MALTNTRAGWGWPARLLHWLMALMIVLQLAGGFYMVQVIGGDIIQRFAWTQTHKSWGVVIFGLALLRLLWRAATPTPEDPPMPPWQRAASRASHIALYALMIGLPLTGWLMASASPLNDADAYVRVRNIVTLEYLFGEWLLGLLGIADAVLLELPDPFRPGDEGLETVLKRLHLAFALSLLAILAVHVGAALKHHLVDRDRVLLRMVRGR
jgi:cytochrome b561